MPGNQWILFQFDKQANKYTTETAALFFILSDKIILVPQAEF